MLGSVLPWGCLKQLRALLASCKAMGTPGLWGPEGSGARGWGAPKESEQGHELDLVERASILWEGLKNSRKPGKAENYRKAVLFPVNMLGITSYFSYGVALLSVLPHDVSMPCF